MIKTLDIKFIDENISREFEVKLSESINVFLIPQSEVRNHFETKCLKEENIKFVNISSDYLPKDELCIPQCDLLSNSNRLPFETRSLLLKAWKVPFQDTSEYYLPELRLINIYNTLSVIKDNTTVFLYRPETYLTIKYQIEFVIGLTKLFPKLQFMMTTDSPFILTKLVEEKLDESIFVIERNYKTYNYCKFTEIVRQYNISNIEGILKFWNDFYLTY